MDAIIATAQTKGGVMNRALPVLPGEALGFSGGQAQIRDHRNPLVNDKIMSVVLMDPTLIIQPTAQWDGWFDRWITLAHEKGGPKAEIRRPNTKPILIVQDEAPAVQGLRNHKLLCTCKLCNNVRKRKAREAATEQAGKAAVDPSIAWAMPA